MSVGSVSYAGYAEYTARYTERQNRTGSEKSGFAGAVEKSEASTGKMSKNAETASGRAVKSAVDDFKKRHPESASHVDAQVRAGKKVLEKNGAKDISREDMTMEEYKLFFTALMDSIPFDASHRGDVEIWSISEKGWEQMKNDPEYEAWVLGYTSENRAVYNPFASWPGYSPNICTEKFGDSIDQHIGQSVSTGSGSSKKTENSEEESWWVRRRKRMKEFIALQEKAARERAALNRKAEQESLLEEQAAKSARLRAFLTDGMSGDENAQSPSGHVTVAASTYLSMLDLFGSGLQ